jgi:hypothetical protein
MPRSLRIGASLTALLMLLGLLVVGVAGADELGDEEGGGRNGRSEAPGPRASERDALAPDEAEDIDEPDTDEVDDQAEDPDAPADTGGSGVYVPKKLASEIVPGTPCTKRAIACVSLGAKKSWIFGPDADGNTVITHGPIPVSTGGPGKETPVGDFVVEWKNKNHRSSEFFTPHGCKPGTPNCLGAPMNWAVFFAQGGIAFHEGTLNQRSSGCVRLTPAEAQYYYNTLQLGDKVEIRG